MDVGSRRAERMDISADVIINDRVPKFIGSYSHVFIGQFQNQLVAAKVLKHVMLASDKAIQRKLEREKRFWMTLKHPNIAPICGYAEGEQMFGPIGALILPNGDAKVYLETHGTSLTIDERVNLWTGVIAGLRFLHTFDPCIVHGDLKPGNILIDDERNPRLCDFRLSHIFYECGAYFEGSPSERHLAYEVVICDDDVLGPTIASDVWALGCIGLEMVFLQIPYGNRKNNLRGHIFLDIRNKIPPAVRPEVLNKAESFIWDILESCWAIQAASRMSVQHIYHVITGKGQNSGSHAP